MVQDFIDACPAASDLAEKKWARFARMGWTFDDWDDLDEATWDGLPADRHLELRVWLRNPPVFKTSLSPAVVREVTARFRRWARQALDAYAAGASSRFIAVFILRHQDGNPAAAWKYAYSTGMAEEIAAGWAATDLLYLRPWPTNHRGDKQLVLDRIMPWLDRFGSYGHLYVLAGYTLEEAVAIDDAALRNGTPRVTREQLEAMVALNWDHDIDIDAALTPMYH